MLWAFSLEWFDFEGFGIILSGSHPISWVPLVPRGTIAHDYTDDLEGWLYGQSRRNLRLLETFTSMIDPSPSSKEYLMKMNCLQCPFFANENIVTEHDSLGCTTLTPEKFKREENNLKSKCTSNLQDIQNLIDYTKLFKILKGWNFDRETGKISRNRFIWRRMGICSYSTFTGKHNTQKLELEPKLLYHL